MPEVRKPDCFFRKYAGRIDPDFAHVLGNPISSYMERTDRYTQAFKAAVTWISGCLHWIQVCQQHLDNQPLDNVVTATEYMLRSWH